MPNRLIKFIFILSYALFPATAPADNLPDLGSPGLAIYNNQTEAELGRAFIHTLISQYELIYDAETLSYIRRIGHHLASHTHQGRHFRFYIINDPTINAFAGPNGVIGIHSGLILSAESEDELASVIAHEIAHITQQHLARRFEQQDLYSVTSFASLLAAILIGSQDPSAGMATLMGGAGLSLQQQLKFSRIHEHEADHLGIELLNKAGYNPHAMANFFGKLAKQYQHQNVRPPEILLTHPVSETRLAQAVNRASLMPTKPSLHDPLNLKLIQQRLRQHTQTTNQVPFNQATLDPKAQCYAKNLQAPDTCLNELIKTNPNNRLIKTLYAQQLAQQNPKKGIEALHTLSELYPQDEAIVLRLAQAYINNNQSKQAIKLLSERTPTLLYQATLYQTLGQIYAQQKQLAAAYLYEALAQLDLQQTQRAAYLIKLSSESPPSNNTGIQKQIQRLNEQLNNFEKSKD
ncbi:MAG: M48 family metalloprotease [Thiomicrospira sp.]